jgi:hypothetical protein
MILIDENNYGYCYEELGVPCIGVDDKLHVCFPWEDTAKCGLTIKNKNVKLRDIVSRYSCYECTY